MDHSIQRLCSVCENLEYDHQNRSTHGPDVTFMSYHHASLQDLEASSAEGCWFCRLLFAGFVKRAGGRQRLPGPGSDSQIVLRTILDRRWDRDIGHHLLIKWGLICASYGRTAYARNDEVVYVLKNASLEDKHRAPEWNNDSHTGSEANFKLARWWLEECTSSHTSCPRPVETELPTRVLDVGPSDGSEQPALRMSYGQRDTYIALSHCWGRALPLTTTKETFEERLTSIPLQTLPQTFQEAVVIARSMGVRYLWMDSLCIIQDSAFDWETESARMGDYFSNCLFAIAATDASDSTQGCFRYRDPWANQPSLMSIPLPHIGVETDGLTRSMPNVYFPPQKRPVHITPRKESSRTRERPPLTRRAWTLQETALSPRTLSYERAQLAWFCKSGEADENNPKIQSMKSSTGFGGDWTRLLIDNDSAEAEAPMEKFSSWYTTVGQYTSRSLTNEQDILPAISGLSSRFQPLTGSRYLAGLWEDDLSRGLLWRVKGDIRPGEQRYRAPSWTWASINLTTISYDSCPKPDKPTSSDWFQIDSVSVETPTKNPFGEVDGGVLSVTARVRKLLTRPPMTLGRRDAVQHHKAQLEDPYTSENIGHIFFDEPRSSSQPQLSVWCLPVFNWRAYGGKVNTIGLALVSVQGEAGMDRFRRIGLVETEDQEWNQHEFPNSPRIELCII